MKIDVDSLVSCVENSFMDNGVVFEVTSVTQKEVKDEIFFDSKFKMLSNEATNDSEFDVDIDDSKFMNDKFYRENWIRVSYGDIIAFACVNTEGMNNLLISAIEVCEDNRGDGFGRMLVEGIESYARSDGFESVVIHSFDTEAEGFWEHIGYLEGNCGKMYKNL